MRASIIIASVMFSSVLPAWSQTAPSPQTTPTAATPAATAASPAAPAEVAQATQSQFKIVIITPGAASPSVVSETTPSLVGANMFPTVAGLIDPNVNFQGMFNRAILTRLSYPPVVIGAPVVSVPVTPIALPSPYRFSAGYDVSGY